MSNLLTASRLRTYRECARKHRIMYADGFRPRRDGEALRFGTLMHRGLGEWWLAVKHNDPERLSVALHAVSGEADAFDRIKAEELLKGYEAVHGPNVDELEVLSVEQRFDAPLLNPETGAVSRTFLLSGKTDVVVRRRATGRVAVVEHKTTSDSIDDADYWSKLQIDHQISLYVLGAESNEYAIDDCLYDVIKKPGIRPLQATPVDAQKFTKAGTLYANQRETDETAEEFRARLAADIAESPAKYYAQRVVPRLQSQLQDALFDFWQTAREIREGELAGRAPRNPDACLRFSRCPFWDVCVNNLSPADRPELYVQLDDVHPELTT